MRSKTPLTIVVCANTSWNIFNFRLRLLESLRSAGYRIVVMAPHDAYSERLRTAGFDFIALPFTSSTYKISEELKLLAKFWSQLRLIRPDFFLAFTIKPILYGSLACKLIGIKSVINISGLGSAYLLGGVKSLFFKSLFRVAMRMASFTFLQNEDDRVLFFPTNRGRGREFAVLPGSGIDLVDFSPPKGRTKPNFDFVFIGRLIADKGLREFVAAAREVLEKNKGVRFAIAGPYAMDNPTAITAHEVSMWESDLSIAYLGPLDDVRDAISAAGCIVLPSYREGVPRVLLEAAAMARPIITTDVPGCREVVIDGVTGFKCPAKDHDALARTMLMFMGLSEAARYRMGCEGRRLVVEKFDVQLVVEAYTAVLSALTART